MALRDLVKLLPEVGVLTHAEAVAADVDDVAMVQEPVDQRSGHDFVAKDLAPFFKALVARKYGRYTDRRFPAGMQVCSERPRFPPDGT